MYRLKMSGKVMILMCCALTGTEDTDFSVKRTFQRFSKKVRKTFGQSIKRKKASKKR